MVLYIQNYVKKFIKKINFISGLTDTKKIGEYIYITEFPKKLNWKLEKTELNSLHRKSLDITLYLKR